MRFIYIIMCLLVSICISAHVSASLDCSGISCDTGEVKKKITDKYYDSEIGDTVKYEACYCFDTTTIVYTIKEVELTFDSSYSEDSLSYEDMVREIMWDILFNYADSICTQSPCPNGSVIAEMEWKLCFEWNCSNHGKHRVCDLYECDDEEYCLYQYTILCDYPDCTDWTSIELNDETIPMTRTCDKQGCFVTCKSISQ